MRSLKFLLLGLCTLVASCSSYVNRVHKQLDHEEKVQKNGNNPRLNDPYAAFREQGFKQKNPDARPIQNPNSISLMNPRRDHQAQEDARGNSPAPHRYKHSDFVDDGSSGSLWINHQGSTMFTTEVNKKIGDLVIINVLENLKNQISGELKRAFPEPEKPKKEGEEKKEEKTAEKTETPAEGKNEKDEIDTKIYDKISGVVAEEVNRDYFLLRGKKEVVFRKNKHIIEVQAMINRKDVNDNDTVNSDKLVESRVLVLR